LAFGSTTRGQSSCLCQRVASPPRPWNLKSEAHPCYSSQQDGGGEKKYEEERHGERLDLYYNEVISQLGQPEALLIFGPGEAKLELKERVNRSKTFSERNVDIETVDTLTDPQIVAKVKEHFRIDR
jgi:hypothetical protein